MYIQRKFKISKNQTKGNKPHAGKRCYISSNQPVIIGPNGYRPFSHEKNYSLTDCHYIIERIYYVDHYFFHNGSRGLVITPQLLTHLDSTDYHTGYPALVSQFLQVQNMDSISGISHQF